MRLLILFLSILVISCGTSDEASNEQSIEQTMSMETNRVIFYHLTEWEFDSLALSSNSEGLNEVDADFSYHASNAIDSLNNTKLNVEVTTERFITIGKQKIDKFDHFGYGVILVRPDSVSIHAGVMTDIDYITLIAEFYGL